MVRNILRNVHYFIEMTVWIVCFSKQHCNENALEFHHVIRNDPSYIEFRNSVRYVKLF